MPEAPRKRAALLSLWLAVFALLPLLSLARPVSRESGKGMSCCRTQRSCCCHKAGPHEAGHAELRLVNPDCPRTCTPTAVAVRVDVGALARAPQNHVSSVAGSNGPIFHQARSPFRSWTASLFERPPPAC